MATKTDGTLWAWGQNDSGALGLNDQGGWPTYANSKSSPTQVGTDTTWSKICAGGYGTFGIKTDGTAWAWGNNCLLYTSPSPRDKRQSRMPSSA